MPIPLLSQVLDKGLQSVPYAYPLLKLLPWLLLLVGLKTWFGGARNRSERQLHSKVIMITGATSGIGAAAAKELALRGAQLVLLTHHPITDTFLAEFILDLRAETHNELITAEQVDLSSLLSIRRFATKWIDNAPPRRLDMVILCANTFTPPGNILTTTKDGFESSWGVNFVGNFHLLSILSPALRAQPPDRDVRVIFTTCSSYMRTSLKNAQEPPLSDGRKRSIKKPSGFRVQQPLGGGAGKQGDLAPAVAFAKSQLALMTFAVAFQKHLSAYKRPDNQPMNAKVLLVDPGFCRTPGMNRYLTRGSLWGLAVYIVLWPFWWLTLKSAEQGAQTVLFAAMEASLRVATDDIALLKECRRVSISNLEVLDPIAQETLWKETEKTIEATEAASRNKKKQENLR